MGVFSDLGVTVDGLEDYEADMDGAGSEEIFRFDVYITSGQEIEIELNVQELEVDGFPEFGEEYSILAHAFANLVVEHIGMETGNLMESVADLPELDVRLTDDEKAALEDIAGENDPVFLYSFPVLIKEDEEDGKQLGVGFNKSLKAAALAKVYGESFAEAEEIYCELVTDDIFAHGFLFLRAVDAIQKL